MERVVNIGGLVEQGIERTKQILFVGKSLIFPQTRGWPLGLASFLWVRGLWKNELTREEKFRKIGFDSTGGCL